MFSSPRAIRLVVVTITVIAVVACAPTVVPTPTSLPAATVPPASTAAPSLMPSATPTAVPSHTPPATRTIPPTSTPTAVPSITTTRAPTRVPTLSAQAIELLKPGQVVKHPPTSSNPYSWFSYFPEGAEQQSPLTVFSWPHSGGGATENYAEREVVAENEIKRYMGYARDFRVPLVLVAIPRVARLYVSSLHLGTFTTNEEMLRRPDLKYIDAVWNQYIPSLRKAGLQVDDRVALLGFSNTATFAYRFALLHPERVRAMWLGAFTSFPLPLSEYNGRGIDYPLGVRNLEALTGKPFDIASYKTIPQFIVVGEKDTLTQNDILCCNDIFSTEAEKDFVRESLGDTNPKRLQKFHELLISLGVNSQFKSYPDVGHEIRPSMLREGFNFILANVH